MGVRGQAHLREVSARLRVAPAELSREVAKELRKTVPKIEKQMQGEALTHMPKRGHFAVTLANAVEVRAEVRTGHGMTVFVFAKGKRQRRDVPSLNKGVLRHPVFGNRSRWVVQTKGVKKGFVDDGARKSQPVVTRAVKTARDKVAKEIVRR